MDQERQAASGKRQARHLRRRTRVSHHKTPSHSGQADPSQIRSRRTHPATPSAVSGGHAARCKARDARAGMGARRGEGRGGDERCRDQDKDIDMDMDKDTNKHKNKHKNEHKNKNKEKAGGAGETSTIWLAVCRLPASRMHTALRGLPDLASDACRE